MKRLLLFVVLLLLPCIALAEEAFTLTATVTAEESALLALPIDDAEAVLPLVQGDALVVTALGTSYCEATVGEVAGYIATADVAFDILNGEPTHLMVIDCSPTNQYHGRITMRTEASTKSKAVRKLEKGCIVLVLGAEGDGLTENTIAQCDYTVKIPMYHGVDSLNVAAASAVAFWELRSR